MTTFNKKNKSNNITIDEYINKILLKSEDKMIMNKTLTKLNNSNIIIPTIHNYNDITKYNYNITQLKTIIKSYKLNMI